MQAAHGFRNSMRALQSKMFGASALTAEEIESRIKNSPIRKQSARRIRGLIFAVSAQEIGLLVILGVFTLAQFVLPFPVEIYDFAFAYYVWNIGAAALGLIVRAYGNARGPYVILLMARLFVLGMNATIAVLVFIQVVDCIRTGACGSDLIYYVSYFVFAVLVLFYYSVPITVNVISMLRLFHDSVLKFE